ncbi:hypothetical protein ACOSQ3_031669 [Xanthoceras sorbifolium]
MARGADTCSRTLQSRHVPSIGGPSDASYQPLILQIISNAPAVPNELVAPSAPVMTNAVPIASAVQLPTMNLPADQLHPWVEPRSHDQAGPSGPFDLNKMVEK